MRARQHDQRDAPAGNQQLGGQPPDADQVRAAVGGLQDQGARAGPAGDVQDMEAFLAQRVPDGAGRAPVQHPDEGPPIDTGAVDGHDDAVELGLVVQHLLAVRLRNPDGGQDPQRLRDQDGRRAAQAAHHAVELAAGVQDERLVAAGQA